ncbi:MAG: DUF3298 and DUF4163 domain-containing protein [Epulopiscium sp.]|nr:DUF3298 and DUF4163 domain-containing protein [Candidatus Epulonipiscium sp.]
MKKKKIIALGLASCVLLSQPIYASSLIKEAPITLTVQREGVKNIGFKTKQMYTQEEGFILNIRIPVIQGLKDIKFQEKLNEKIEKEMMKDKKNMEQDVKKHLHQAKKEGVEVIPYEMYVDYDIKSNGDILSFTITTATSFGNNWMERVDSYNIDCKQNKLLDLKDLFKNGSDYKKIITDQIQQEMKEQIQSGKGNYFEEEIDFKNISAVQSFYIQGNNIVITFPKYSIAPGSMGTPEFKIPFSFR